MRGLIGTRSFSYCAVVVFAGMLAGCASTSETSTIEENLSILNQRQAALESRLQSTEGASRRSSDQYAKIEELQTQMRILNGRIEQLEHKLDQLQRAQAPSAQAPPSQAPAPPAETIIPEQGVPPASQPPQPQSYNIPPSAPPVAATPPHGAPAPSSAAPGKSPGQAELDRGVQLMQQKKYEAARKEFQGLVSKYPNSSLDEIALYNIGECYYLEKHYEDAIKAYQQVVDKYPQGDKTAGALLKEAMGWEQMGETTMARIIYTRLVEKYPGTAQARAAEKKLQQM